MFVEDSSAVEDGADKSKQDSKKKIKIRSCDLEYVETSGRPRLGKVYENGPATIQSLISSFPTFVQLTLITLLRLVKRVSRMFRNHVSAKVRHPRSKYPYSAKR